MTLTLEQVAASVDGTLHGRGDVAVRGLSHDSRRITPGMLFCALPGERRDGGEFVADAQSRGAAAVLAPTEPATDLPWVSVPDARAAMVTLSRRFYGDPSREMCLVGITGTNGKTTTSFLTAAVLEEALGSSAALGTLGLRRGGTAVSTGFTTPEAPELAALLRSLVEQDVRGVAMEVSSHALVQGRVAGLSFGVGVFTNLSHEHLDYHHTLDAYREAKLGFFDLVREADGWAVVNLDDDSAGAFLRRAPRRVLTYSQRRGDADLYAHDVELDAQGSRARVSLPRGEVPLTVRLGGGFNVSNALAALAVGVALDLTPERAAQAIRSVEHVPGRFELYHGGGRSVLVDYAHTPDAFERVLVAAREIAAGELTLIFGCGGERDRDKRPLMGEIAGRLADKVYVTIDNPRGESLDRIMEDVARGLRRSPARWARLDDREQAIGRALAESRPGDLVALLGKGDESYQEIAGVRHPHSDRDIARRELARLATPEAGSDA